jgi:hypothetical protein
LDGTQAVIERTTANTQTILTQMDNRGKEAFERMDQRADE